MSESKETNEMTKDEAEENAGQRRRTANADSDPGVIRVRLPLDISTKVRETISELKTRGVSVTAENLLVEFLCTLPEDYLANEVQKRTPEEFYIRAAIQIPELREMLARQAKRALVKGVSPERSIHQTAKRKRARSTVNTGTETETVVQE